MEETLNSMLDLDLNRPVNMEFTTSIERNGEMKGIWFAYYAPVCLMVWLARPPIMEVELALKKEDYRGHMQILLRQEIFAI